MQEALKIAGLVGAMWFLISIPTALFLGRVLRSRSEPLPAPEGPRLVSDERFAQQAGEQR